MKRWLTVLLCVLLAFGETGCAKQQENETEEQDVIISVLAGQSTSDAGVEDMIDEWMQKNFPTVSLEWECVDWGDKFNAQMRGRFAAGEIPDIIIGKAQDVQIYAKSGNLAAIPEEYLGKVTKDALMAVTVDGEVYGIPYNAWYQGVIYNKDIFRQYGIEVPTTVEELECTVQLLEENNIVPFASHFQESWEVANMTMQFFMNDIFKDIPDWGDRFRDGEENFKDHPLVKQCLENNRFVLQHTWDDALQINQYESDSRFMKGEAAMYLTGSWSMQFSNQYSKAIDFGIFPYPNQKGDAKLIKETNMTFMKSAKTEQGDLIDQIFDRLFDDQKLAEQQLLWLHNEIGLEQVLEYADRNRALSRD